MDPSFAEFAVARLTALRRFGLLLAGNPHDGDDLVQAALLRVSGRSFTAIGEWAADAPQWVLELLGARWHPGYGRFVAPHETTLRRTIGAFDAEVLDAVMVCA